MPRKKHELIIHSPMQHYVNLSTLNKFRNDRRKLYSVPLLAFGADRAVSAAVLSAGPSSRTALHSRGATRATTMCPIRSISVLAATKATRAER